MDETYAFGDFRLDARARALTFRASPVKLTAKSIAVLIELARRAPGVVSRADFEAAVWPEGFIEASNLTQTIYMIRSTLARVDRHPMIDMHNGHGYRIAVPVRRVDGCEVRRGPAAGASTTSASTASLDVVPHLPALSH